MTDVQRRILEDLAKRTRQSSREEWEAERENLEREGWIQSGLAIAGAGHYVTDAGKAALKLEQMKEPVTT